jgi:hypothetical protein
MPVDPTPVMLAVAAVVAGLMVFAVLVLAGVGIVRRLGLPRDLPEGPSYEPPPPPVRDRPDRAAAQATAQAQARLQRLYDRARSAAGAFQACQELLALVATDAVLDDQARAAVDAIRRAAATAKAAAEAAEPAMRRATLNAPETVLVEVETEIDRQDVAAEAALVEARKAAEKLPDHRNRRLWFLLILLAVMVAWMAVMLTLTRRLP